MAVRKLLNLHLEGPFRQVFVQIIDQGRAVELFARTDG